MTEVWSPATAAETVDAVRQALAADRALELIGRGTRRGFGRPVSADLTLDLSALTGVLDYDPAELVLTVRPGTPLAEIEALLASNRQRLEFEPPDFGPLWGAPAAAGTIGGAILTGRGGPRRVSAGGPRDHCLGATAINGFGDVFASGGQVIKNVTGYDLPKLLAGSFGTLGVVTELSLKVLPAAPVTVTLALWGLEPEAGVQVLTRALGSPAQVSGAAFLPEDVARGSAVDALTQAQASATLIRLEGVAPSVEARLSHLSQALSQLAPQSQLEREPSLAIWKEIGDVSLLGAPADTVLWKLSVPPGSGARVVARIRAAVEARFLLDWGGGALWLQTAAAPDAQAGVIRRALAEVAGDDGHATLVRAPEAVRASVGPFQPLKPALALLTEGVRRQFDPRRLFNPGRMYED